MEIRSTVRAAAGLVLAVATVLVPAAPVVGQSAPAPAFVENRGAWPERVAFALAAGRSTVWLRSDGVTATGVGDRGRGAAVEIDFCGAVEPTRAKPVGEHAVAGVVHSLGARSMRSARRFARVRWARVWAGIDVVARADEAPDGPFAYDLLVAPGADLDDVVFRVRGQEAPLRLAADGSLVLTVRSADGAHAELVQRAPISWIEDAGERRPVVSRFRRVGDDRFGFAVDGWDGSAPLVVDPGLRWSTYLGGGLTEDAYAIARRPDGRIVTAGWAASTDFPTTPGAYSTRGERDAFVAEFAADGTLRWATYLGGVNGEEARAVALAPDGAVVVGGFTTSSDFPVSAGAFQTTYFGGGLLSQVGDGFVSALDPDGDRLRWSTFVGRRGDEFVEDLHVDAAGRVTVIGTTTAGDFPTTAGVVQPAFGSASPLVSDVFVMRLNASGSDLIWSTYFGGEVNDVVGGMSVGADGSVTFCGLTSSPDFPIVQAVQPMMRDPFEAYVATLAPDARSTRFATFLGGDGYDQAYDVVRGPLGDVYVCGLVSSGLGFPGQPNGYQPLVEGEEDAFVLRLSADGRKVLGRTYIGGAGDDVALAIDLLANGDVCVVGATAGGLAVTPAAAQASYGGGLRDGFVVRFDAELRQARYVSYLGGAERDDLRAVVVGGGGGDGVLVAGSTRSADVPGRMRGAQPTLAGASDALVASLTASTSGVPSIAVTYAGGSTAGTFAPGERVLGATADVRSVGIASSFTLEHVRLAVAGSVAVDDLVGLFLYVDQDGDGAWTAADPLLSGPEPVGLTRVVDLPGNSFIIDPSTTVRLFVVVGVRASARPGVDLRVALPVDGNGWAARGADNFGIAVTTTGEPLGARLAFGTAPTFDLDADGDGVVDVRDARWFANSRGNAADGADPDGDGRITPVDVDVTIASILRRPAPFRLPADVFAGGLLQIDGLDLEGAGLVARLGGLELPAVASGERQASFAVPAAVAAGPTELVVFTNAADPVELARGSVRVR